MVKDNVRFGSICMVISSLFFALMQFFVKMAGDLPFWEKAFFRNILSVLIVGSILLLRRQSLLGEKRNRRLLMQRSFFGTLGVVLYFYSLGYLNMADAAMLNRISPFVVMGIAALWLKERVSKAQIAGLLVTFAGVLMIIRPEFSLQFLPALGGFASAVFAGVAYVLVRVLKGREEPLTIVFFFSLFSTVVLLPAFVLTYVPPEPVQWAYLSGIGLAALLGQFFLTVAYKYAPAGEVSIFSYVMVVFSVILGYTFLNEVPDILSMAGGLLILTTAVALYLGDRTRGRGQILKEDIEEY